MKPLVQVVQPLQFLKAIFPSMVGSAIKKNGYNTTCRCKNTHSLSNCCKHQTQLRVYTSKLLMVKFFHRFWIALVKLCEKSTLRIFSPLCSIFSPLCSKSWRLVHIGKKYPSASIVSTHISVPGERGSFFL